MTMPSFLNPRGFKNAMGEYPTVSVDDGWPQPHLLARPNDELGQAIINYVSRWKDHPDFPPSPWDSRRGEIFLRDLDEPEADSDEAPKYRVKAATAFIGPSLYARGAVAVLHGWPLNMADLEPENESARRVVSYKTRYGLGRRMMEPPYAAGRLQFENPALWGVPLNATHVGTFGSAA
jgi:hypothetical protein